jgi:hypothetical protein
MDWAKGCHRILAVLLGTRLTFWVKLFKYLIDRANLIKGSLLDQHQQGTN